MSERGIEMLARIFRPAPTAMQSGKAASARWVLEWEPEIPPKIDPLMGYTSSYDTRRQVRLEFDPTGKPDLATGQGAPGRAQLYVDGHLVGQSEFPRTIPLAIHPGGLSCGANPVRTCFSVRTEPVL